MTFVTLLWLSALFVVLFVISFPWSRNDIAEYGWVTTAKTVIKYIVITGIVMWAVVFFRAIGAFGSVTLP